jgi:hypothetical protein
MKTKPCIICGKKLKPVQDTWDYMQPYDGGQVKFIFAYGSTKFDLNMGNTVFNGVICDNCAEQCIQKMVRHDEIT